MSKPKGTFAPFLASVSRLRKTELGNYRQDASGLWHYQCTGQGSVRVALGDALKNRPDAASWFWWNDTPSPIFATDDAESLFHRWYEWRLTFQKGQASMLVLALLEKLAPKTNPGE